MRYEGWTLRKAEVRLAEHRELREALGLDKASDYTTFHRFLNRLDERVLDRALGETVRRGPSPSRHAHPGDNGQRKAQSIVAVDATGLSPVAISTYYAQRTQNRGGKPMLWRKWLKWLVVVDAQSQLILAPRGLLGPLQRIGNIALTGRYRSHSQPVWLALGRCGIRQRAQSSPCVREDRSAGGERLFGGEAQALDESPWKKPRNAADTGFVTRADLRSLPAQAVLGLRVVERAYRRMSTEPDGF